MILPENFDRFQAALIRGHLRLMSVGMKHSTLRQKDVMDAATRYTGTAYKKGELNKALKDICDLLDADKAANNAKEVSQ